MKELFRVWRVRVCGGVHTGVRVDIHRPIQVRRDAERRERLPGHAAADQ